MSLTPFAAHLSNSFFFMRREAFAMSGVSPPTPAQKRSKPPPVPVLSILGVLLPRSEEHTSELQSLMRISYAVFCLKKKMQTHKCSEPSIVKHTKIIEKH